ncbi:MAG: hypothetical protein JST00_22640 [Deltaproteobacteria bacterium]|nr:hypothetical protein [Deltaproteobacteria bacterium]
MPSCSAACVSSPRRSRSILAAGAATLALALVLSGEGIAHAQDAQTQAMGRSLFNEAVALFNKGDYEAACLKFEASLKAFPGIGTRGKLAECYEKQGRIASAWQTYRDVAQLATKSGDATREQVAAERAKALEPKLSYVTVVLPPSSDVPGLVVKRNGKELERSRLGTAEPTDPGTVVFDLSAPGRKQLRKIVAVKGDGARITFEVPALAVDEPSHVDARPAPEPATPSAPPLIVETEPPQWQKPVGVVAMGVGAVGLGLGTLFGLSASAKYDAAFDEGGCSRADNTCDRAGQDKVDDARSKATLSTVFFVAGGVLAAGGIVLFLTAPKASRPQGLYVMPAFGGATVGGVL